MKAQAYKESLNSLRDPDNDDEDVDNETTSVTETIMNRDENYHENPDELNADKSDNDGSKESD
jgi:hypothetical protein